MSNCITHIRHSWPLFFCAFWCLLIMGCGGSKKNEPPANLPLRDHTPQVLTPEASGTILFETDHISFDASHTAQGYFILIYTGTNEKVKFQIAAPNDVTYTYLVTERAGEMVFPLTGGSGTYTFSLLESVNVQKNLYAISYTQTLEVQLEDELLPYLTPNVYVNFSADSVSVEKGSELATDCYSDLDVIENVYHFVTQNISYDSEKAQSVAYGYIPNPDETLESGTGICFDYASLMTAMLRSQRIPARLEVGYAGEVYHAWISCYVEEIGWVDNIIEFNGKTWSLMDPTLAAGNNNAAVQDYIGDGSKYLVKYTY